jgi:hypothetical protein
MKHGLTNGLENGLFADSKNGLADGLFNDVNVPDISVQLFLNSSGITNLVIISALNTLVRTLKSNGIWDKRQAIYPFVGGSAHTHKFNLKDARDLDAAFRITWVGGVTHDQNGFTGNGTTGYGNTNFTPSVQQTVNDTFYGFYSRTDSINNGIDFGGQTADLQRILMAAKYGDGKVYGDMYNFTTARLVYTLGVLTSQGWFTANRRSDILYNIWRNETKLAENTNVNVSILPALNMLIGAYNYSPIIYSARNIAFGVIGSSLTDAECLIEYNAIQTFQTTLGRQV